MRIAPPVGLILGLFATATCVSVCAAGGRDTWVIALALLLLCVNAVFVVQRTVHEHGVPDPAYWLSRPVQSHSCWDYPYHGAMHGSAERSPYCW